MHIVLLVSSRPDCIFEIYQLWQSGFSRVYSYCCCSCSFEPEIIKIGQSSHKMYSNNILNFQESTTILNACTKKVWKLIECTTYAPLLSQKVNVVLDQVVVQCIWFFLHQTSHSSLPGLNWFKYSLQCC